MAAGQPIAILAAYPLPSPVFWCAPALVYTSGVPAKHMSASSSQASLIVKDQKYAFFFVDLTLAVVCFYDECRSCHLYLHTVHLYLELFIMQRAVCPFTGVQLHLPLISASH